VDWLYCSRTWFCAFVRSLIRWYWLCDYRCDHITARQSAHYAPPWAWLHGRQSAISQLSRRLACLRVVDNISNIVTSIIIRCSKTAAGQQNALRFANNNNNNNNTAFLVHLLWVIDSVLLCAAEIILSLKIKLANTVNLKTFLLSQKLCIALSWLDISLSGIWHNFSFMIFLHWCLFFIEAENIILITCKFVNLVV